MREAYGTKYYRAETRVIPDLVSTRPDVVIRVTREVDPSCQWDGDAPDPTDEGFDAYTVTVQASTIRDGRIFEGESTLGSSWCRPEEPIGDIHGYFPQMLEEALDKLDSALKGRI